MASRRARQWARDFNLVNHGFLFKQIWAKKWARQRIRRGRQAQSQSEPEPEIEPHTFTRPWTDDIDELIDRGYCPWCLGQIVLVNDHYEGLIFMCSNCN